jgi:hypothetical protein
VDSWWITTGIIQLGGKRLLGPFPSFELAQTVRRYIQDHGAEDGKLWIDEDEPVPASGETVRRLHTVR